MVLSGAHMHVNCLDQGFKWFARHLAWELQRIVFTEFKAGFGGWCLLVIHSIFSFYTFGFHSSSNVGGDRGITRKHRKPEALWSPWKVFVATQKHCWWDAYTGTTYHHLLQLVTVIEKCLTLENSLTLETNCVSDFVHTWFVAVSKRDVEAMVPNWGPAALPSRVPFTILKGAAS